MRIALATLLLFLTNSCRGQANVNLQDFIPAGFVLSEKTQGDLNADGQEDLVLLIKSTDPGQIIDDDLRGTLDRNRRGLVVLFRNGDTLTEATRNLRCFPSENEDGGVYFPPELSLKIDAGDLHITFSHGRYGSWSYMFRHLGADFSLVSYKSIDSFGPVTSRITSLDFLAQKKLLKVNISQTEEEEVFESTWTDITAKKLVLLSEIEDFIELTFD